MELSCIVIFMPYQFHTQQIRRKFKNSSKRNGQINSAEIRVLYFKLDQFQKIREIKVS